MTNLRAPIALCKDAGKRMVKAGGGRIINVGSAFGEAAPLPGDNHLHRHQIRPAGIHPRPLARTGPLGVTVNGVQPGPIDTELLPDEGTEDHATMIELASVGRFGKLNEIAAAVAYLASPEAAYTNGESFTVDGGWNA